MRNSYKYTLMYSGAEPEFIEGDVFKIIIPLSVGSMTKVGPGTSPVASAQVGAQVSAQVGKSDTQDKTAVTVKLDIGILNRLMDYCSEPRSGSELQQFCGISSREYFRKNVLMPLVKSGRLKRTIPDKPNSSKQKYIKA